nr:MAG TPA: hypothetical protein [Caudoviricetes sp.]
MGDRSSIIIRQCSCDDKGIEIYGHWAGTQIICNLPRALRVAKARWDDEEYFTRVIKQNILNYIADPNGALSCGIGITDNYKQSNHGDLEYNPVIINRFDREVTIGKDTFTFGSIINPLTEQEVLEDMQKAMLD